MPPAEDPASERNEIIQFDSQDAFIAWAKKNVDDWETFVENSLKGMAEYQAWRAAGNTGLPPGYMRRGEYERQRAVRSGLQ